MQVCTTKTIRSLPIRSIYLSKETLKNFCYKIQTHLDTAFEEELKQYKENLIKNKVEYTDKAGEDLKDGFKLRITICGEDGKEFIGTPDEVFSSPDFPENIISFYLGSANYLRASFNYVVRNSVEVFLDFRKPDVFNFSIQPSEKTHNESQIKVEGYNSGWVNGLFSDLLQFFDKKKTNLHFLHYQSMYDMLVWILGIPTAFYLIDRLTPIINKISLDWPEFIINTLYVFIFLLFLSTFRILFQYARWIWPTVEYRDTNNNNIKHRLVFFALIGSFPSKFLYDAIKYLFVY